jgi:hypothetical protein
LSPVVAVVLQVLWEFQTVAAVVQEVLEQAPHYQLPQERLMLSPLALAALLQQAATILFLAPLHQQREAAERQHQRLQKMVLRAVPVVVVQPVGLRIMEMEALGIRPRQRLHKEAAVQMANL